jgi:peptidyl-prolyl cis-trans isomerase A (cyclophilin A)
MPSKKLTAQKREELKRKKEKQQSGSFFPILIIFIIIAIIGVAAIYYLLPGDETEQNGTSEVTENRVPSAVDDYSAVAKNSALLEIDLLANDIDPDGDILNVTSIGNPSNGVVELIENIAYYTPNENFAGIDTFDYTIEDEGGETTTSTIHVFVTDPEENPLAFMDTSKGMIVIELYEDKVPITAGNFIRLVNDGFYNGMNFYRILDDFMIQAGRYFPDGSEDQSPYGNIEFETHEDVTHADGAISMASTGAGVGGSAEFFICDGAQPGLDGSYAPFGVVIDGIDVLRDIAAQPHDSAHPAGGGTPLEDIIINSITIENQ